MKLLEETSCRRFLCIVILLAQLFTVFHQRHIFIYQQLLVLIAEKSINYCLSQCLIQRLYEKDKISMSRMLLI